MKLMLRKIFFKGYAHRCAERLCLSVIQLSTFLRLRLISVVKRGGAVSKSQGEFNGKAQPFRTSGGTAAIPGLLCNISNVI